MPEIAHHTAVTFEGEDPRVKHYPPGTCFDAVIVNVELRYDHSAGAWVLTHVLRVTGARDTYGNSIPYPQRPRATKEELFREYGVTDAAGAAETFGVSKSEETDYKWSGTSTGRIPHHLRDVPTGDHPEPQ